MIILLNARITDARILNYRHQNGLHFPTDNRLDVFKYCLSSYFIMDPLVTKYYIYVDVANEYLNRFDELKQFIYDTFPKEKLVVKWKRNDTVPEWQNVCREIDTEEDKIIWLACNDDHIFMDSSLDVVADGIELMKADGDPMSTIYYSHFPENIKLARYYNAELTESKNYVKYLWNRFDSIQIIKTDRLKAYWMNFNDNGGVWHRSDEMVFFRDMTSLFYTPTKEIVRHFDGYGHVGDFSNITPSLCIPSGFFENQIKIRYGYEGHIDGVTSLNPSSPTLFSIDPNGVDYRWNIEDIPLFWKEKIESIEKNPDIDQDHLDFLRNHAILATTQMCQSSYNIMYTENPPTEWFENHMIKK